MRVAFFGLGYHEKTGSSRFLLDLLREHAEVETFFAEASVTAVRRAAPGFDERAYDAIVIWQLHEAFALLSGRHPNVTFAPMHDAMWRGGAFTWRPSFNAAKILCFSWALAAEIAHRAPVHARVQYYPAPDPAPVTDFDTLRGFLWYRRREVPPQAVFAMTAGTSFESIAIHDAPDPGHRATFPTEAPKHVGRLIRSTWSEDGDSFRAALSGANVFFAPRPLEGIGMAFLEAMARGLCVVAPDAATMNEYISHGANGLLHMPGRRAPLDFADARDIGARARESIARGHARWQAGIPALLDFLTTPRAALAGRGPSAPARWPLPAEWHIHCGDGVQQNDDALRRALAEAPSETLIIRGHHVAREPAGGEMLNRIGTVDAAWARMLSGDVGPRGPRGLGVPEATLVHGSLLDRYGLSAPQTAQQLCALVLRARKDGVAIHDADEVLARRPLPEDWPTQRRSWYKLVAEEAGASAAATVLEGLDDAAAAARTRRRAAMPARVAIALIALCDLLSPALGRGVEGLIFGGAVRRLRARLRR